MVAIAVDGPVLSGCDIVAKLWNHVKFCVVLLKVHPLKINQDSFKDMFSVGRHWYKAVQTADLCDSELLFSPVKL